MTENRGKRILLVEDDEIFAATLMRFLEKQGLQVQLETRGDRAVQKILSLRPDAVLLDCNLPGRDGFEICREARSGYAGPIIMLTARDDDLDQVLGLGLGADAGAPESLPAPLQ
jgi:DNA-binding response OmpR family regulator